MQITWSSNHLWFVVQGLKEKPMPEGLSFAGMWYYPATPRYARLLLRFVDRHDARENGSSSRSKFLLKGISDVPGGERIICRRVGREVWLAAPPEIMHELKGKDGLGSSNGPGLSFSFFEWEASGLERSAMLWGMIFDN